MDSTWKISFLTAAKVLCGVLVLAGVIQVVARKKEAIKGLIIKVVCAAALYGVLCIPAVKSLFDGSISGYATSIPVVTWLLVILLCLFNVFIMKTRLGQKLRAVGQSRVVANASGINVDTVRIIAIMISTVLAGWGQILFMQSEGMGTFQAYSAHEQVGLYAGAAILVGGASIDRASNSQALIGTFLFHLMFITATGAATRLFGDSAIGEYFRAFLSYGVIALALVMYAWRGVKAVKKAQEDKAEDKPKDAPPA